MNAHGFRRLGSRVFVGVIAAGVVAAGATGSTAKPTVAVTKDATLGSILVNTKDRTVYRFLDDHGKTSACTGACAKEWPPVVVAKHASPVAGSGVLATKLGTTMRADGTVQVTYAGYPLYLYAGDTGSAQTHGQGVGEVWFVLAPSGATIKTAVASAPAPANSGSASSSSGSGGGGAYG